MLVLADGIEVSPFAISSQIRVKIGTLICSSGFLSIWSDITSFAKLALKVGLRLVFRKELTTKSMEY